MIVDDAVNDVINFIFFSIRKLFQSTNATAHGIRLLLTNRSRHKSGKSKCFLRSKCTHFLPRKKTDLQDLRRKAARLVAAKCTLAARVDACHESVHGEIGLRFKEDIEKKLDKLQEPPPVKFAKPLPKPIEGSKKKRGGKRVRKMKERYALTEFRKQANRLNFGDVSVKSLHISVCT